MTPPRPPSTLSLIPRHFSACGDLSLNATCWLQTLQKGHKQLYSMLMQHFATSPSIHQCADSSQSPSKGSSTLTMSQILVCPLPQGSLAECNAMVKILLQHGIEVVIKGVDNFIFICYPSCCLSNGTYEFTYSAELAWNITDELGWPWVPAKFLNGIHIHWLPVGHIS